MKEIKRKKFRKEVQASKRKGVKQRSVGARLEKKPRNAVFIWSKQTSVLAAL